MNTWKQLLQDILNEFYVMAKLRTFIIIICMQLVSAMYIRPTMEPRKSSNIKSAVENAVSADSDWSIYKRKLGLTDEKGKFLSMQ